MKAALYARYSSDNQRAASIEDQLRLCREFIQKQGWEIGEIYSDHALSGASLLRPGIQELMADVAKGGFDVIVSESIDRISRDQGDIAGFYKRMTFAGLKVVTLAEGEISEMHIGFKGTMGALFLKDLADKTRRGLRGRVEAGKSGGGNSFGYDVVTTYDAKGEPEHGARKINEAQAAIVRRIFTEYANGKSPRSIAHTLNAESVPGPTGNDWGSSTIHGNPKRGTGILNNEIYIGLLVWNRLRYIKDPDTGKRVSRPNPPEEWVVHDVPDLRIIEQDLWERVKERQKTLKLDRVAHSDNPLNPHRRARYLFSSLIKCGVCGGGMAIVSQAHIGCSTARNKGTCPNKKSIKREEVERRVLTALRTELMHPEVFAEFCDAFTQELNRAHMEAGASLNAKQDELERIDRELEKLLKVILSAGPIETIANKMKALEARKIELQQELVSTDKPVTLLHPNMANIYRERIEELHVTLNNDEVKAEAVEIIRSLVDAIVITPEEGTTAIELQGSLAGILALSQVSKKPAAVSGDGLASKVSLVAGRGFEPLTFRL